MYIYICIWQLSEFMGFVRCPNLRLELDDLSEVSRVKPSWWLDICQPFLFLAQKLIWQVFFKLWALPITLWLMTHNHHRYHKYSIQHLAFNGFPTPPLQTASTRLPGAGHQLHGRCGKGLDQRIICRGFDWDSVSLSDMSVEHPAENSRISGNSWTVKEVSGGFGPWSIQMQYMYSTSTAVMYSCSP